MAGIGQDKDFSEEIALLYSMFGGTVSTKVIQTVIESCNGDVNLAADAIMSFDTEKDTSQSKDTASSENYFLIPTEVIPPRQESPVSQLPPVTASPISQDVRASSGSFADAFRNTGAVPKIPSDSTKTKPHHKTNIGQADQIRKIVNYHSQGTRTLIIMRGAPGSGKSYLARHIIDSTTGQSAQNYVKHIFSTDDYFIRGGVYQFDRNCLQEAHMVNQKKVCDAANKGLSPIIVDNTNIEIWEMEPYVRDGVRNGYIIEIVEPETPWARNANQLSKRNIHGVPRENIRRMLDKYDYRINSATLLNSLRLVYPTYRKPPVKRNIPAISPPESPRNMEEKTVMNKIELNLPITYSSASVSESPDSPDEQVHDVEITDTTHVSQISDKSADGGIRLNPEAEEFKIQKIIEAQKSLEQIEIVEKEWDNGDSWDAAEKSKPAVEELPTPLVPKPPRQAEKPKSDTLIETANICNDWTKIAMFMPPWHNQNASNLISTETPMSVETFEHETCFEVGDLHNDSHKICYGVPRDINEGVSSTNNQTKRTKILVDKSTATHGNDMLIEGETCKNKEYHFKTLRRMFKNVPRPILRDIFENCNSDVNWVVNLVLDSYPESQGSIGQTDEPVSDTDEEPIEECNCLAAYNIIPEMVSNAPVSPIPPASEKSLQNTTPQKKPKRDVKISDTSLQLKRQIESNVMISDNHYSQHYLNTRRRRENVDRYGASSSPNTKIGDGAESNASCLAYQGDDNASALQAINYEYSNDIRDIIRPSTSSYNFQFLDLNDSDEESDSNKSDYFDQTVSVNLGTEFLAKLDELFGRQGFQYPEYIKPSINLPMSILQQINAHWAMSVACQMDDYTAQSEQMIKQDEDFARQLAAKEEEMSKEGKEPDVPTLKEIMDMELAYSIYEKNVAEWRNNEPQDLAAKLSREKLYNLFSDLPKDVLSEMLMAHDYNFKSTVESLLISTGQQACLEDEKGIEKFVMRKEMERKEKFLEEQNKNLSETEWPYLKDLDKPITLDTVSYYRAEAQKSLNFRNVNFEKARHYFARNSPHAASFYSEIAALHTKRYEQSSCMAAAYLMNYHLKNNPDQDVLDLHFLRVAEAMVNLDIFLDQIILKLRSNNIRYKNTWIITGKGTHSIGGPRIKPATKRRLTARDIVYNQINGGLLMTRLYASHKMTSELEEDHS